MKKLYFRIFAVIMALTMMVMCMTGCMPADTYALDDEPAATTEPIETEAQTVETEAPTVAPILETETPATEPPADHMHSYTETVIEPTCTKEGYTRYACDCGYAYNGTIKPATGHNMKETDRVNYTCDTAGHYTMTCTDCGYEETHEIPIHSYYESYYHMTENGHILTHLYQCEDCGYFYIEEIGDEIPHTYKHVTDLIPCGDNAYYDNICTDCNATCREHVEPKFAEHDFIEDESLEPGFRICSHCGRVKCSPEWE